MTTKIKQTGIDDLAVGQQQLGNDSVTAAKIVDGAVGTAEIATDSILSGDIAPGAVGTSEILDGTITTADMDPAARPAFTKSYTSSQQTITLAGLITLAHGLGVAPALIQVSAVCITTEAGYVAGDVILVSHTGDHIGNSTARGLGVYFDATNINLRVGTDSVIAAIINKTTGAIGSMTPANWKLVVRAWA